MKLAFRAYAVTSKALSKKQLSLTRGEFITLLEAARVMDDAGMSRKAVHGIFVFSQCTVLDEFQRSKKDLDRDDSKTLSFEELLEALARVADVWEGGKSGVGSAVGGFDGKLTRFLFTFLKNLSL